MSFKNVMWGSKEFNNRVIATVPSPEGPTNENYIVGSKFELISVKDSDPAIIRAMLNSGSYRFATEKEVQHWEFRKECELYR